MYNSQMFKETLCMYNRLSLTCGRPEVLSKAPIVQIQVGLTWALLCVPITCISSKKNFWVRVSFLLTNSSQWSVLRYIEENETEYCRGGNPRPGLRSTDLICIKELKIPPQDNVYIANVVLKSHTQCQVPPPPPRGGGGGVSVVIPSWGKTNWPKLKWNFKPDPDQ
jgi:hypothetical protein